MKKLALDLSGMGGGYENHCQLLFQAGLEILKENPKLAEKDESGHYHREAIDGLQNMMVARIKKAHDADGTTGAQIGVATSAALHVYTKGMANWIRAINAAGRLDDLYDWDGTANSCPKTDLSEKMEAEQRPLVTPRHGKMQ